MTQATKVVHRMAKVRDLCIFYREAGPKDAPAVLLLPCSTRRSLLAT